MARAETETAADVPAELRGREVSGRMLSPIFDALARRGHAPERLAEGTGLSVARLRDRGERIPWTAAKVFCENLGRVLSDDELVALGASLVERPIHRALAVPGRILFSLTDVFDWLARPDGPLLQLVAPMAIRVTKREDRYVRFTTTMKPGYACPREFWLLRQGFLTSISAAFGLAASEVTALSMTPEGSVFEIVLPRETGLLGRVRKRATWMLAASRVAAELRDANEDLHARYVEVQREVEARKAAEEKLQQLNEALEARVRERTAELEKVNHVLSEVNHDLTMFNAAVAHDLRAPLRAVSGFTSFVLEDHGTQLPLDAKTNLERVVGAAERMETLIDALQSLARVGRGDLRPELVDLGELARHVVDELRAAHPRREVDVVVGEGLVAPGDQALLRALLENLLGNAWKFTRDRAPARIALVREQQGTSAVFCVEDNGAGFDMKRVDRLFTPFQRLHTTSEYEGTGIGLSICERIVRRHGGRIWAESHEHSGASFRFTLG